MLNVWGWAILRAHKGCFSFQLFLRYGLGVAKVFRVCCVVCSWLCVWFCVLNVGVGDPACGYELKFACGFELKVVKVFLCVTGWDS